MIVYTTVFGSTKPLHEPLNPGKTRFVCFTDQAIRSEHWEIIEVPRLPFPSRECRRLKILSHIVFPQATATLWMDSNFTLLVDPAQLLKWFDGEMVTFRHPHRNRISDETLAIIRFQKAVPEQVMSQLAAYQSDGFDTESNPQLHISAGGFLLRRHTEAIKRFNEAWHHEVQTKTLRDQMSIDYCAWKIGIEIRHFAHTHLDNPYASMTKMQCKHQDY